MSVRIGGSIIFLLIAVVAWRDAWKAVRTGRSGYLGGDSRNVSRERSPVVFWVHTALDALAGLIFGVVAVLAAMGYAS